MREESPHLVQHPIQKVDIILTKSMFKGCGWLNESGMSWEDYWAVFRKYRHALYITNISKKKPEKTTELNYQFLNTVSLKADEFRPADLPGGWDHSPEEDPRNWLTKQTELAYYSFCADKSFRQNYFFWRSLNGSADGNGISARTRSLPPC
nr:hypothetical protein [Butyricicoccus sp. AF10-3]